MEGENVKAKKMEKSLFKTNLKKVKKKINLLVENLLLHWNLKKTNSIHCLQAYIITLHLLFLRWTSNNQVTIFNTQKGKQANHIKTTHLSTVDLKYLLQSLLKC